MDNWTVTLAARRSLIETFEQLDDDQWTVPSLSDGWTIREVLAHLILAARPPKRRYLAAVVRARGSFDRANHALAVADARRPVPDLIAGYRAVADHRFSPPGWPSAAPLGDILLHSLDVRIPLGLASTEPPAHYAPALRLLFGPAGRSFGGADRPAVRWVGTDHEWSHGTGPDVRGTMADLALVAGGRAEPLPRLDGEGAPLVRAWLG